MTEEQEKLVLNNLGLVHICIKKYIHINPSDPDYEDYYQEGCLGLIMSCMNYDPDKGFRFSTYSTSYIHGYLLRYKYYAIPLVRYPRSRYENKKKIALYLVDNPEVTPSILMEDLGLSYSDYLEATHEVEFLEGITYTNDDGDTLDAADTIPDPSYTTGYDIYGLSTLYDDIDNILDDMEFKNSKARNIFTEYLYDIIYVDKPRDRKNQKYYARKYGCSQAHVSRMIKQNMDAFKAKLKDHLTL